MARDEARFSELAEADSPLALGGVSADDRGTPQPSHVKTRPLWDQLRRRWGIAERVRQAHPGRGKDG